jgi:hypothetical protein
VNGEISDRRGIQIARHLSRAVAGSGERTRSLSAAEQGRGPMLRRVHASLPAYEIGDEIWQWALADASPIGPRSSPKTPARTSSSAGA